MAHKEIVSQEEEIKEGSKKITDIAEKIHKVSKNKELRARLYPIVEKIDQSPTLEKFRTFWDKVPHPMQWAIIYMPQSIPNVPGETIKLLIELGLIEYKGGSSDNDIKSRNEWKLRGKEWSLKIGALFIPELKPIIPLLEPIKKIDNIKNDIFTDIRFHIREQRQKREDVHKAEGIRKELGNTA